MSDITRRVPASPALIGEIVGVPAQQALSGEVVSMFDCPRCSERHSISNGYLSCCCEDTHDPEFCCRCGHFHVNRGATCMTAPCGDYRCCIN